MFTRTLLTSRVNLFGRRAFSTQGYGNNPGYEKTGSAMKGAANDMKNAANDIKDRSAQSAQEAYDKAKTSAYSSTASVGDTAKAFAQEAKEGAKVVYDKASNAASSTFDNAKKATYATIGEAAVKEKAQQVYDKAAGAAQKVEKKMEEAVKSNMNLGGVPEQPEAMSKLPTQNTGWMSSALFAIIGLGGGYYFYKLYQNPNKRLPTDKPGNISNLQSIPVLGSTSPGVAVDHGAPKMVGAEKKDQMERKRAPGN